MPAVTQSPLLTKNRPAVIAAPSTVNNPSSRTRALPLSAIAPINGATSATIKLAIPLAIPNRKVLSVAGTPAFQKFLKNKGKNPAMTVQANAEFAQSYIAQPNTGRRVNTRLARFATASEVFVPATVGNKLTASHSATRWPGADRTSDRVAARSVERWLRYQPPLWPQAVHRLLRDANGPQCRRRLVSLRVLARLVERDVRPTLLRQLQVHPRRRQVNQRATVIQRKVIVRLGPKLLEFLPIGGSNPTRRVHIDVIKHTLHAVLVLQPERHNLKLQLPHGPQDHVIVVLWFFLLCCSFFVLLCFSFA